MNKNLIIWNHRQTSITFIKYAISCIALIKQRILYAKVIINRIELKWYLTCSFLILCWFHLNQSKCFITSYLINFYIYSYTYWTNVCYCNRWTGSRYYFTQRLRYKTSSYICYNSTITNCIEKYTVKVTIKLNITRTTLI